MFSVYDEFVRQRQRDTEAAAAHRRLVDRAAAARRWRRAAVWTADRAAKAEQESQETRLVPSTAR